MKFVKFLAVILVFFSSQMFAQSIDDILQKHFDAIGQKKLLEKGQFVAKGKVIRGQMEIPYTSFHKKPMKFKSVATFQGMEIVQAFDGQKGWTINPFTGSTKPEPLTDEQNEKMKIQADFGGLFHNYKEKGYKVTLLGKETMDDVDVYVIELLRPNGDDIKVYMDAENYVILKTKFKTKVQGTEQEFETYLSNYKSVDGIVDPFDIETKFKGNTVSHIIIDSIDYNVDLPDSIFQMPADKPAEEKK